MDETAKDIDNAPKPDQPKRAWGDLSIEEKLDFLMNAIAHLDSNMLALSSRLNLLAKEHIALKNGALAFVDKVSKQVAAGVEEPKRPIIIPVRGKFRGTRLH